MPAIGAEQKLMREFGCFRFWAIPLKKSGLK